jgi:peptidoglycan hydrolase CwlO-like protein
VKQKELQPWTAKLNKKQAEIDVATSERDALSRKAEAVKEACNEAQENLEKLQAELAAKVIFLTAENRPNAYHGVPCRRQSWESREQTRPTWQMRSKLRKRRFR